MMRMMPMSSMMRLLLLLLLFRLLLIVITAASGRASSFGTDAALVVAAAAAAATAASATRGNLVGHAARIIGLSNRNGGIEIVVVVMRRGRRFLLLLIIIIRHADQIACYFVCVACLLLALLLSEESTRFLRSKSSGLFIRLSIMVFCVVVLALWVKRKFATIGVFSSNLRREARETRSVTDAGFAVFRGFAKCRLGSLQLQSPTFMFSRGAVPKSYSRFYCLNSVSDQLSERKFECSEKEK